MFTAARNKIVMVACTVALGAVGLVATSTASAQSETCFGYRATIVASPGQTTMGTSGPDVIIGTSGNDVIYGRGGGDLICSGGGADVVYGGKGNDWIATSGGSDTVRGGKGADVIYGGDGSDDLKGKRGADTISGDAGRDDCKGGRGSDSLHSCNESAPQDNGSSASGLSADEAAMVEMVQELRAQHGAGSLSINLDIADVARDWSANLPDGFFHNPNVGSQIPAGWWAWGENIAYNGSVEAAFVALVNSPGHFRNMVNPAFTDVGIGVHVENGRVYVTQVFARY